MEPEWGTGVGPGGWCIGGSVGGCIRRSVHGWVAELGQRSWRELLLLFVCLNQWSTNTPPVLVCVYVYQLTSGTQFFLLGIHYHPQQQNSKQQTANSSNRCRCACLMLLFLVCDRQHGSMSLFYFIVVVTRLLNFSNSCTGKKGRCCYCITCRCCVHVL